MEKLLTEVCKIQYGFPFDSSKFNNNEGMPLIRIRDINSGYTETFTTEEYKEEYVIKQGDILIGMDGEFNVAKWSGADALLNQRVCRLLPLDIDVDYLYYFMPKVLKEIEDKTPFVTVKHLSAKQLNSIVVSVPSLERQQFVAKALCRIDEITEKRRQQLQKLDELVKARFVEMFGEPSNNSFGWEQTTLKNICVGKLTYGSGASACEYDGNIRYIRITDIKEDGTLNDEIVSPNVIDDKYFLNSGDILFARSGATVGKTYCHNEQNGRCIYAGYLIRLIPDTSKVLPEYVFYYTKTNYYTDFISSNVKVVAQPNINAQQYGDLIIGVPPIGLQNQFVDFVQQINKSKLSVQKSLDRLETLKKALMQKYFG